MTRLDRIGGAIARLILYLGIAHNILRLAHGVRGAGNFFTYLSPFVKLFAREPLTPYDVAFAVAAPALFLTCIGLFFYHLRAPMPSGPPSSVGSATLAALLTAVFGIIATVLATLQFQAYGWTLFVLLPVILGFTATLIDARTGPPSFGRASLLSVVSVALTGAGLVLFAVEGVLCMLMAAPVALPLAFLGSSLGYLVVRPRPAPRPATLLLILFLTPHVFELESYLGIEAPVFSVSTSTEIAAPIDVVWRATIAPSKLRTPQHWAFKAGIAYPRSSWIEGTGLSATRYCDFSTGRLIEPVLRWQAPAGGEGLLRFTVVSNPSPMQEWTPYGEIHPPHLEGFLASRQGEFRLIPIDATHTRLEATTWYQHHMAPAVYWRLWSDYVIHRVHDEVLLHVKMRAESGG